MSASHAVCCASAKTPSPHPSSPPSVSISRSGPLSSMESASSYRSGIPPARSVSEPSPLPTTAVPWASSSYTMSPMNDHLTVRNYSLNPSLPTIPCPGYDYISSADGECSVLYWRMKRGGTIVAGERLTLYVYRYPHLVCKRRATCYRRRQQDLDWKQVRLGGEACCVNRTRPRPRRRAGHPLPRSLRQIKHQYRQGVLQPSRRYQEATHRQPKERSTIGIRCECWR